ncbi:UPF0324 membrane protein [Propionispora sp. 2/2-37]|uniref:YeiH family protein n=1 Tax=Propionispora sp. 2/2-37 TaxID=1677858 RepID=UPI0006C13019|nr:YeiH family protein [Propionispora sp. 2/2-37]CUH97829.1 UPF0324 membrane protein [Propionispora sp. 2/2-37]
MEKITTNLLAGVAFAVTIAIPAWYSGVQIPLIGGPVFGILFGMILAFRQRSDIFTAGIRFAAKNILQYSIILLGFEMNLFQVFIVGSQSLFVMIFTLSAAFITAWLAGKYLGLPGTTSTLIGVGTAICGGSAIAAAAPAIKASEKDIAYSISTIFLFNIIAVFIFPFLGHLLHMSDLGFGMWAGTAINDTSSVVAAGYSYSQPAGSFATIVKLTRTLMIVPVTLTLSLITVGKNSRNSTFSLVKSFPWFILGFLLTSIISTTGVLPSPVCSCLAQTGRFFIIVAMAAIGLNTNLRQLVHKGIKPVLLGLSCWLAVAAVSLAVQNYLRLW